MKFPKRIVQDAVDRMRRAYDNPEPPPRADVGALRAHPVPARSRTAFTRTSPPAPGASASTYGISRGAGGRPPWTTCTGLIDLVNRLTDIDYTGLPVSDQEVPFRLCPVRMAAELAKYTTKFGGVETFRR